MQKSRNPAWDSGMKTEGKGFLQLWCFLKIWTDNCHCGAHCEGIHRLRHPHPKAGRVFVTRSVGISWHLVTIDQSDQSEQWMIVDPSSSGPEKLETRLRVRLRSACVAGFGFARWQERWQRQGQGRQGQERCQGQVERQAAAGDGQVWPWTPLASEWGINEKTHFESLECFFLIMFLRFQIIINHLGFGFGTYKSP